MIAFVADTHALIWYLFGDSRLSPAARDAFVSAAAHGDQIGISTISLIEIVYLHEKQRIPPDTLAQALVILRDPASELVEIPVSSAVVEKMRFIERSQVPDLPDRVIAATGLCCDAPAVSRDARIRAADLQTVW